MKAELRPSSVMFDIGMTLIFPSGEVIAEEVNRRNQGPSVTPLAAARALAVAAEMHHFCLADEYSETELVGLMMGTVLEIPRAVGIAAWEAAASRDDLYSSVDPAAPQVLASLRSAGILVAAVSNSSICVRDELASFGLLQYFDIAVGSNDGFREKPAVDMFEFVLDRLGVGASQTCHVGDGLIHDILGASKASIGQQILVDRYGVYTKPPCARIRSVSELPRCLGLQ